MENSILTYGETHIGVLFYISDTLLYTFDATMGCRRHTATRTKKNKKYISGENRPAKNYTCNKKGVFTLIYHLSPIGTILLLHLTACSLIASYEVVVCGVPPK